MNICQQLRNKNQVIINEPENGTYCVINKYPSNYKVSGYIDDRPINLRITSETELWEFSENL